MDLHALLEASNLVSYEDALIEQGADDVDQLVELSPEEFTQLCSMVAMDKKPFHVLRLKKALDKKRTTSTSRSRDLSPTLYSLPAVTPANSRVLSTPQTSTAADFSPPSPASSTGPPLLGSVRPLEQQETAGKSSFLPPFLQSNTQNSDFSSLLDSQTLIQNSLGPPPCSASTWDEPRKAIIKKHSLIHHENIREFEAHINEASYQLCMRDPTLLVRRDELFLLSKRAVRQGYEYHNINTKPSLSVAPVVGTKRDQASHEGLPLAKRNYCDPNEKLFTRERLSRMKTILAEMNANVELQKVKLIAMDEAKSRGDALTTKTLQEHIDSLMDEQQQLTNAYNVLKRRQNRSERYYRHKEKRNAIDEQNITATLDSGPFLSPIEPIVPIGDEHSSSKDSDGFPVIELKTKKRKTVPKRIKTERESSASNDDCPEPTEVKSLVDNISNVTDQVSSIFRKEEMKW